MPRFALSLVGLDIKTEYRSDQDDIIHQFYIPCLEQAVLYERAVGYFTSSSLASAAIGIVSLLNNDGKMCLIASPYLNKEDIEAINEGYRAKEEVIESSLLRELDITASLLIKDRLSVLAWMIYQNRLDIQIAFRTDSQGNCLNGLFHEKLGIFHDQEGNFVVFTGSANETASALEENFEVLDVFVSWKDDEDRAKKKTQHFQDLWENRTEKLTLLPFPDAATQRLLSYRSEEFPQFEPRTVCRPTKVFTTNAFDALWPHQRKAIEDWEANNRRGVLSMATGSGKTRTALNAAQRCNDVSMIVISVPYNILIDQWESELQKHGFANCPLVRVAENASDWHRKLFNQVSSHSVKFHGARPLIVIGTTVSLSSDRFIKVLEDAEVPRETLLIVDEVHHSGAPTFQRSLHPEYAYRLGLSATPERYFDAEGTNVLLDYFDGIVSTYEMADALRDKHLAPYQYHVFPAHINHGEYEEYQELTQKIARLLARHSSEDSEILNRLYGRRADILKQCESKINTLSEILGKFKLDKSILYCSDNAQLDRVCDLLNQKKRRHLTYTSRISQARRREVMDDFAANFIPTLVAINCLDEGVDVPDVREAVLLASSSNNLQFIQRRGRILRKSPTKTEAILIDILALPPEDIDNEAKSMLRSELRRIKEIAELANNRHAALMQVKEYARPYGVYLVELLTENNDG